MGIVSLNGTSKAWSVELLLVLCAAGCYGQGDYDVGATREGGSRPPLPRGPAAVSDCGRFRLVIEALEQKASARGEQASTVTIRGRFEFVEKGFPAGATPAGGRDIYLNNSLVLKRALAADGTDLAANTHSAWASNCYRFFGISDLEVGRERGALHSLELALEMVKVERWEAFEFKGLGRERGGPWRVGPFELTTNGSDTGLRAGLVQLSSVAEKPWSEGGGEPELAFMDVDFVLSQLRVSDSSGRQLTSYYATGGWRRLGTSFHIRVSRRNGEAQALDDVTSGAGRKGPVLHERISYPATVEARLPAEWTTSTATFRFEEIALPSLAEGKRAFAGRGPWAHPRVFVGVGASEEEL